MSASATRRPAAASAVGRDAPWCTSDPQAGREAGGLGGPVADHGGRGDDERRPARSCGPGGRARSASCRDPCRGPGSRRARRRRGSRSTPGPRPGSVRSSPDEPLGPRDRRGRRRAGAAQDVGGPAVAADVDTAAQPRAVEADALAEDLGPGQLRRLLPLGQRGRGLLEVDAVELDPPPPGLDQRPGLTGQPGDVGGRRARRRRTAPTTTRCSAGAHRRPIRPASRRTGAATASPCAATASARGRRSRPWPAPGRTWSSGPTPRPG